MTGHVLRTWDSDALRRVLGRFVHDPHLALSLLLAARSAADIDDVDVTMTARTRPEHVWAAHRRGRDDVAAQVARSLADAAAVREALATLPPDLRPYVLRSPAVPLGTLLDEAAWAAHPLASWEATDALVDRIPTVAPLAYQADRFPARHAALTAVPASLAAAVHRLVTDREPDQLIDALLLAAASAHIDSGHELPDEAWHAVLERVADTHRWRSDTSERMLQLLAAGHPPSLNELAARVLDADDGRGASILLATPGVAAGLDAVTLQSLAAAAVADVPADLLPYATPEVLAWLPSDLVDAVVNTPTCALDADSPDAVARWRALARNPNVNQAAVRSLALDFLTVDTADWDNCAGLALAAGHLDDDVLDALVTAVCDQGMPSTATAALLAVSPRLGTRRAHRLAQACLPQRRLALAALLPLDAEVVTALTDRLPSGDASLQMTAVLLRSPAGTRLLRAGDTVLLDLVPVDELLIWLLGDHTTRAPGLVDALELHLGTDAAAWDVFVSLAPEWTGSVTELLNAARLL